MALVDKPSVYVIFFTPFFYASVSDQCKNAGGNLAVLKQEYINDVINYVLTVKDECGIQNFWVKAEKSCSELNVHHKQVEVAQKCVKEQGFICEIVCQAPQGSSTKTWSCNKMAGLECDVTCIKGSILIGPDRIICTNAGWVTHLNKTTVLPTCESKDKVIDIQVNTINDLKDKYSGFLFIVDESNSVSISEWWAQLQFVASMVQVFPLSLNWTMGLIMFSSKVRVPIRFEATDTCTVLEIINKLTPDKERDFTFFKEALEEADNQIKTYHGSKPSLIFFISDGDNNGDDYNTILEDLKNYHVITTVGINTEKMDDLNLIASMVNDRLLMFKYPDFESFTKYTLDLLKYRTKRFRCSQERYILQNGTFATTTTTTTTTTTIATPRSICKHSAMPITSKSFIFIVIFTPHSYKAAFDQCTNVGGNLVKLNPEYVSQVYDTVRTIEDHACAETNFWINAKSGCSQLNIQNQVLEGVENCFKEQGFICEIVCATPKSNDGSTWDCQNEDVLECGMDCKENTVLIGPDNIMCTNIGWVTNFNKTTYLPSCDSEDKIIDAQITTISNLKQAYNGFLFIVDESYSISTSEWWMQLQFIVSLIQVFPISVDWTMGLIMFSSTVSVPIPFKATDTCRVLEIIGNLTPNKERDFTYYKEALEEAGNQIKTVHGNKPSIIFLISDGDNNGDDYDEILETLQKHHIIISVGINTDRLSDLNKIASLIDNRLLMYKFRDFESFKTYTRNMLRYRSKILNCLEKLYILPDNTSTRTNLSAIMRYYKRICGHPALPLKHQTPIYVIFFKPYSYQSSFNKCYEAGGDLAEVTQHHINEISNTVVRNINDSACAVTNFWINSKSTCSQLHRQHKLLEVAHNCSKEQGFICEIVCEIPKSTNTFSQTDWKCQEQENNLECEVKCKNNTILIGSDNITCSDIGWVTNLNQTTYLPSCKSKENLFTIQMETINKLKEKYNGFLFIVDESNSITTTEWWAQLQFVASMIQVFPLSVHWTMGLIMFGTKVHVPIPYKATETCKVLKTIKGLTPNNERDFASFKKALQEADRQIETFHNNNPSFIFLISDGNNNGDDYNTVLEKLKERHLIISVGISTEQLPDLNEVASMFDDKLLMYKFSEFGILKTHSLNMLKYRSPMIKCPEKLYVLPTVTQHAKQRTRINSSIKYRKICDNTSISIKIRGVTYTTFFSRITYLQTKQYCKNAGGQLANLVGNQITTVLNSLKNQIQFCRSSQLWVDVEATGIPCGYLNIPHKKVSNCTHEHPAMVHSFICQSGCPDRPNTKQYAYTIWKCYHLNKQQNCHVTCKNQTIMVGTHFISCSTNGWVTTSNFHTNFPICLNRNDFENIFLSQIGMSIIEHHGILFIFDKSHNKNNHKSYLKQLDFMEDFLDIFPPSISRPVSLILFDENARTTIYYNETNFCMVRRKLHYLQQTPSKHVRKQRQAFYDRALLEAEKEIKRTQNNRKTIIFFVASQKNSGGKFAGIANRLKKKHTIISIAHGDDGLKDMGSVASMISQNMLMYSFNSIEHIDNTMKFIRNHNGRHHHC